jgi:hypothetical protein
VNTILPPITTIRTYLTDIEIPILKVMYQGV